MQRLPQNLATGVLALCAAACQPQSVSVVQGLTTDLIWDKTTLSVCWYREAQTETVDAKYETAIADLAKREYTAANTGIALTGFGDCSGGEDVKLVWGKFEAQASAMASQIGLMGTGESDSTFNGISGAAVKFNTPALIGANIPMNFATEIGLHELGHIVGLFHEHAHPDSTCKITPESAINKFNDLPSQAEHAYLSRGTAYDPYSVMSYCRTAAMSGAPSEDSQLVASKIPEGLSDGDRSMLLGIYGPQGSKPDAANDPTNKNTSTSTSTNTNTNTNSQTMCQDAQSACSAGDQSACSWMAQNCQNPGINNSQQICNLAQQDCYMGDPSACMWTKQNCPSLSANTYPQMSCQMAMFDCSAGFLDACYWLDQNC